MSGTPAPGSTPLHALIPVKGGPDAKSRLGADGTRWAQAFLEDVMDCLLASTRVDSVTLVTADARAIQIARHHAVQVVDDQGQPLNDALSQAAHEISPESPVLVVLGDVPCITADILDALVADAPAQRWFTADSEGTGSTMLWSPTGAALAPAFGPRSRAAHRRSGALEYPASREPHFARVHRDVDTPVDLWDAVRLGVGAHTSALVAQLGLPS